MYMFDSNSNRLYCGIMPQRLQEQPGKTNQTLNVDIDNKAETKSPLVESTLNIPGAKLKAIVYTGC